HKRDLGIQVEGNIMRRPAEKPNPALGRIRERILNEKYREEEARNFDNVAQVRAMDKEGLDIAILYPSRGLFVLAVDGLDPDLAAAIAKAYNDWMYEFCKAAPDRMYGAAIVAPHDVSSAVEETRRIAKELGFRSILMRPNHVNGRRWSDPYYDPLWSECRKLNSIRWNIFSGSAGVRWNAMRSRRRTFRTSAWKTISSFRPTTRIST